MYQALIVIKFSAALLFRLGFITAYKLLDTENLRSRISSAGATVDSGLE